MSEFSDRIDALGIEDLLATGSLKWTTYPDAIGAWVAEMDFGLAPVVRAALDEIIARGQTGYAPMALRTELGAATAGFVADRYGWQLDADLVHQLPDVLTGFGAVMTHWLPAGSKIIVPTPCYMPFTDMPAAFGHQLVELPMHLDEAGWQLDLAGLEREFAAGARLLVLCNPHNPIGKAYTTGELTEICQLVDRYGALVFADEIHAPVTFAGVGHQPYAALNQTAAEHTVTAMSASKAFNLAGLKCAQLVLTNPAHQRQVIASGHGLPYESSPLGMAASIAAYRHGGPWLAEVLGYLQGNRDLLVGLVGELLPGVRVRTPEATFLAWLDARASGLANPHQQFLDAGVALTDGALCGAAGAGAVRFNFALPRPLLRTAVERMASAY